jgi:hypothetical protein
VVLFPGAPGYEDDLLLRADKNPNTRGAQDMGLPAPATTDQLAAMAQAIEQGVIKVLYAIDTDLQAAFGAEAASRLTARLDGLIVQASHWRAGYEPAQVLLPSAMPASASMPPSAHVARYCRPGRFTPVWRTASARHGPIRPQKRFWRTLLPPSPAIRG